MFLFLMFKYVFMHKKYKENTKDDTLGLIPYEKLVDNAIQTKLLDKKINWIIGIKLKGFNFYQLSLEKQLVLIEDLQIALKGLDFPIQMMAINRPSEFKEQIVYLNSILDKLKQQRKNNKITLKIFNAKKYQILKQIEILKNDINGENNILFNKEFYVYGIISKKENIELTQEIMINELSRVGFEIKPLDRYELVNSLIWRLNPIADVIDNEIVDSYEDNIAELIAPKTLNIMSRNLKVDDLYLSVNGILDYPLWVRNTWGADIVRNEQVFIWNINHQFNSKVRRNLVKASQNARANLYGIKDDISRTEIEYEIESYQNLIDSLYGNAETLKGVEILAISYADNLKDLGLIKNQLSRSLKTIDIKDNPLMYRQKDALIDIWPQHYRPLNYQLSRLMPTYTLASSFPFIDGGLSDKNGMYFGKDVNNETIIFNQFFKDKNRTSFSIFIAGEPGKGKIWTTKKLINFHASIGNKVVIVDVEREYKKECDYHGGEWINLGVDGINPLQIFNNELGDDSETEIDAAPLSTHLSIFKQWFKMLYKELNEKEERVLLREVQKTYQRFNLSNNTDFDKLKTTDFPTMSDLYDTIVETSKHNLDSILQNLKEIIEYDFLNDGRYTKMFNRHTSIKLDNDFIVLDIHSLYDEGVPEKLTAQLYLTLGVIKGVVKQNRIDKLERNLLIVIDEAHTCVDAKNPAALDFMFQMVKRDRKYRTGLIITTQNWSDMTGNGDPEIFKKVSALLRDCQVKILMPMDPDDVAGAEEAYATAGGFTDALKSFLTHAEQRNMVMFLTKNNFICLHREVTDDEVIAFDNKGFIMPQEPKREYKKKEIITDEMIEDKPLTGKDYMDYDDSWIMNYDPSKRPNLTNK